MARFIAYAVGTAKGSKTLVDTDAIVKAEFRDEEKRQHLFITLLGGEKVQFEGETAVEVWELISDDADEVEEV